MYVRHLREDRSDDTKDSFHEEPERAHNFLWISKVPHENCLSGLSVKATIRNEILHEISNDNGVRVVNFVTSKNLIVKSAVFPHRNIYQYNWTSPDGKTYNQFYHLLIDKRRHWFLFDVRYFRGANCDTGLYLMIAKVRERLSVSKRTAQSLILRDLFSKRYMTPKSSRKIKFKSQIGFELLKTWTTWT